MKVRKCVHCGVPGEYPFDRCDDCAKVGHKIDVEQCLCRLVDVPGILGASGIFSRTPGKTVAEHLAALHEMTRPLFEEPELTRVEEKQGE